MYVNKINFAPGPLLLPAPEREPSLARSMLEDTLGMARSNGLLRSEPAASQGRLALRPTGLFATLNLACRKVCFVGHIELLPERDRKLQTIPK
jgi:hypothetical protein